MNTFTVKCLRILCNNFLFANGFILWGWLATQLVGHKPMLDGTIYHGWTRTVLLCFAVMLLVLIGIRLMQTTLRIIGDATVYPENVLDPRSKFQKWFEILTS